MFEKRIVIDDTTEFPMVESFGRNTWLIDMEETGGDKFITVEENSGIKRRFPMRTDGYLILYKTGIAFRERAFQHLLDYWRIDLLNKVEGLQTKVIKEICNPEFEPIEVYSDNILDISVLNQDVSKKYLIKMGPMSNWVLVARRFPNRDFIVCHYRQNMETNIMKVLKELKSSGLPAPQLIG